MNLLSSCLCTFVIVLLAGDITRAQTTNPPDAGAANEPAWSVDVSAYTYLLSESDDYVQPTVSADRGRLHLEARYNYENLNTGSAWVGVNFGGGTSVEWELTPMLAGVFGDTAGIAPGFKGSIGWRWLELSGESEYVFDARDRSESFLYNWSELTLAPADWTRFGLVTQRTRVYQSDREIQRGVMASFSIKRASLSAYVFNPDDDGSLVVLAAAFTF